MLSRVLPFDDEDDKEIARQTIQDAPDFSFEPWDQISQPAIDIVRKLLEKNRAKRPSLQETLQHEWFSNYKDIHQERTGTLKDANGLDNKFQAFTLTEPNSPKLIEDINEIENSQ